MNESWKLENLMKNSKKANIKKDDIAKQSSNKKE